MAENAGSLIDRILSAPRRCVRSLVGRRLVAALSFVRDRRSADGLDDHLAYLAELDAEQSHGSFALARLAAWMIPILGFLGTVIGITMAIANVTPAQLESSLDQVTGGLAVAFDTTALALCLSMALMFVMFVVERGEQQILRSVDRYVHSALAHRFLAGDREVAPVLRALASTSQMVVEHTEKLVEKQAELWRQSLTGWQTRMETLQRRQDEQLEATRGLLQSEGKRWIDGLRAEGATQTEAIRGTAQRLDAVHAALTKVAEQLAAVVQSSGQLGVLQSRLNQNLETLRAAESLDEAMHSLTAAIHLLTVRHASRLETADKQAA
jgi:biopolymer transport protein ExbB/TolQ